MKKKNDILSDTYGMDTLNTNPHDSSQLSNAQIDVQQLFCSFMRDFNRDFNRELPDIC